MVAYDCVDACIILESLFGQKSTESCEDFIRRIGYKLHNPGLLTVPLIGEIFSNLFLKISAEVKDPVERKVLVQNAIEFFEGTVLNLLQQNRLIISKIKNDDYQYVLPLQELHYGITDDDALHLSSAINNKCQRFITIDKELLQEKVKGKIKQAFGLIITSPN